MSGGIQQVIDNLRGSIVLSESITIAFDQEMAIRVNTNSAALKQELQHYFTAFVADSREASIVVDAVEVRAPELDLDWTIKQPDPGKTKIKEEYYDFADGRLVRKKLTGVLFAMSDEVNLALGPCHANSNQVINFVNNRYIEWQLRRGGVLAHAAGVELEGRGMALAGFSGMGKSTLALQLMNRGCRFVSNDRLVLHHDGSGSQLIMYGVAKHPRVNPGTLLNNEQLSGLIPAAERKELGALSKDELWTLEQKYDAIIDEIYGPERFVLNTPLDAVVLLNWNRDKEPLKMAKVDLKERADLLGAIMKQPGLFYRPATGGKLEFVAADYIELLQHVPVYEVSGGVDFSLAADDCMKILR